MKILLFRDAVLTGILLCGMAASLPVAFAQGSMIVEPGALIAAPKATLFESKQNLLPSLVGIRAVDEQNMFNDNGRMKMASAERMGNGIIIDPSGIIVTSAHIVNRAKYVLVRLPNGTEVEARVIYTGKEDFSFLKVNVPGFLKPVVWADSSRVRSGDPVVAIIDRESVQGGAITKLVGRGQAEIIEMDVDLKHGDSGGPVFDEQGGLLGLVMARAESQKNKSYAVASNTIHQEYLKFKGSVLVGAE